MPAKTQVDGASSEIKIYWILPATLEKSTTYANVNLSVIMIFAKESR